MNTQKKSIFAGLLFVSVPALIATYLSQFSVLQSARIAPTIIGMVFGIGLSPLFTKKLSPSMGSGVHFCSKTLLRLGVILYGFRVTLGGIFSLGWSGFWPVLLLVCSILIIGTLAGRYWFHLDTHSSLLISIGCAICGAAAILALEPVLRAKTYKSVMAVSVIVIFGTTSMFLYPLLFRLGILGLADKQMALFIGSAIHEVAHVVGAGEAVSQEVAKSALIIKMLRVVLLIPVLLVLGFLYRGEEVSAPKNGTKTSIGKNICQSVPWFAVWFFVVIVFHSLVTVPPLLLEQIRNLGTFFLTLAMTSLGMQIDFRQLAQSSRGALSLGLFLFVILFFGGYTLVRVALP